MSHSLCLIGRTLGIGKTGFLNIPNEFGLLRNLFYQRPSHELSVGEILCLRHFAWVADCAIWIVLSRVSKSPAAGPIRDAENTPNYASFG